MRGLRFWLVEPLGLAVLFLPLDQLERGLEVVGELAPFLRIQVVPQRPQLGMPEELPHLRPVLLLTMRVVVLAEGPAARPGQLSAAGPGRMPVSQRPS